MSSSIEPGRRVPGIMRECLLACERVGKGEHRVNRAELLDKQCSHRERD